MSLIIAPSLLAANPAHYADEIASVVSGGADWLHLDVMDGTFVPPITFGDNVVKMAKAACSLTLDVHLMVERPEKHIQAMRSAGADYITVHQEVSPHLHRTLGAIRESGAKAGVALNPSTPATTLLDVLELCDLVLVMTVNPGWGGQPFISQMIQKIELLAAEIRARKLATRIEVDGGITAHTARQCVQAGASILVAGSSVFHATDRSGAIRALRV